MGQGGRKPKPRHLKVIAGTLRKHRDQPDAPAAVQGALVAPDWMQAAPGARATKEEKERHRLQLEHFGRVAAALEGIGCASPTFQIAVVQAARLLADMDLLSEQVAKEGLTYTKEDVNGEPMVRAHAAAQLRVQTSAQIKSLLAELGLTPTSLAKASKTGGKPAGNAFKELG